MTSYHFSDTGIPRLYPRPLNSPKPFWLRPPSELVEKILTCHSAGHAPCDVTYYPELNKSLVRCPRCGKSVLEDGDMR